MTTFKRLTCAAAFILCAAGISTMTHAEDDALVVYSARKEIIDKPIFEAFTQQTGIKIKSLHDDTAKVIARLKAEGADSPADVLVIVDSKNLAEAVENNLLQAAPSAALNTIVPEAYRDAEQRWYGLGTRARVIFYNKERVKPEQLSTYEDLADPKWKNQLLVRSASSAYNISLLSAMIAAHGVEVAEGWAKGIATNLARAPQGGDIDQIKAIAAGEGTIGIANTYYYAKMLTSDVPEERAAAQKVGIFFPNQNAAKGQMQGVHVNISGAGVVRGSKNADAALKFIEFLASEPIQRLYADGSQEYPINNKVEPSETLKTFGTFKVDTTPVNALATHSKEAVRIADRAGWK